MSEIEIFDVVGRGDMRIASFDVHKTFKLGDRRSSRPEVLLQESGWTLFAYDFAGNAAVFVRIDSAINLAKAPFCYLAQFEAAQQIALVPLATCLALAERLSAPRRLVQHFNMGHCGSTLLHHVCNSAPGAWSISEPMYFHQLAMARDDMGTDAAIALARAGLRFLTLFTGAAEADVVVVKHFSQSTTQFKTLHAAAPDGRCLFLYRDALGWTNSVYHFAQKMGGELVIPPEKREFVWWIVSGNSSLSELDGLVDLAAETVTFDEIAAVAWALHVRHYRKALADGVPLMPVRYNELTIDREATVRQIFDHCGIANTDVSAALKAFEIDSHAGTRTARSISVDSFDSTSEERVLKMLNTAAINLDPNVTLANASIG